MRLKYFGGRHQEEIFQGGHIDHPRREHEVLRSCLRILENLSKDLVALRLGNIQAYTVKMLVAGGAEGNQRISLVRRDRRIWG